MRLMSLQPAATQQESNMHSIWEEIAIWTLCGLMGAICICMVAALAGF